MARSCRGSAALALTVALTFLSTAIAAPTTQPAKKAAYPQYVKQQSTAILDKLESDNDASAAQTAAAALFQQTILFANDDKLDAFRDASFLNRLTKQMADVPDEQRVDLLKYLRKNSDLASAMVFLIRPGVDKSDKAYALLSRLREKNADKLNAYATLAAAVCVVHDSPLNWRINENKVTAADAVDIFEFYVKNEKRMFFGVKNVPAELLVYVVDSGAQVDEMQWALDKYAGDKEIGRRFFDIKYDYDHLRKGTEKAVTGSGNYTLPNILKYGGVCADQAYFAVSIGKSIGVPTAYTVGASGEVGHAWVGFLQQMGRNGGWNFNSGRYSAYQGVRGNVTDPQTRKSIPDSYVSLLGELITTKPVDRQNCIALTDAVAALNAALKAEGEFNAVAPADAAAGTFRAAPRKADAATILGLTELALRQSAGYAPTWFAVRDMAVEKQLTLNDKRHWADVLMKLGAQKYPDFTLAILMPMVQSVENVKEQDGLWNALLPIFKTRFDLSANIKMAQAEMWEAQNEPNKAGACYIEIVEKYANNGPFILPALAGAEKLLRSTNRENKVVQMYEQAWTSTKKPQEMAKQFITQSNWYRVGKLYAAKLKEAGDNAKAETVLAKIDAGPADAGAR